jgi:class 3 adenylate cyclase
MSGIEVRDLRDPESVVTYPGGSNHQVRLGGTVITRSVLKPGWTWEKDAKPIVGTSSCQLYHRGLVLSGRLGVKADGGDERVVGRDQVFDIPPGHVMWVEGDEDLVLVEFAGGPAFAARPGEGEGRVINSILFTDIVDSTSLAEGLGDDAWRRTLAMHEDVVRSVFAGFGGREIQTAGDSFLMVFDGAERAIRCGLALVEALESISVPIRVGVHTGEVMVLDDQVHGIAVHAAARILALAGRDQVLVSSITRDLAQGSTGLEFDDMGQHRLKGLDGDYRVFRAHATV